MRNNTKRILQTMFYISMLSVCTINNLVLAHTLKTPKGTTISHSHPSDTGWSGYTQTQWTDWSDAYYAGVYDSRYSRANKAYNCHAFAWADARWWNSSKWCWINTPQDNKYWNDGSYDEVSSSQATKVNYGDSKDHSLVKLSGSVLSKWGKLPAYYHQLYSDPYGASPSDTKFYRLTRPSVSISGPSSAPCATGTWTANVTGGIPPYNYRWYHKWDCSGQGGPEIPCDTWVEVGSNSPTLQMYLCSGNSVLKVYVDDSIVQNPSASDEHYVYGSGGGPSPKMASQVNALPEMFGLSQNYPNPFNPETEIRFDLPEHSDVKLTIINSAGKEVITLAQGSFHAGVHNIIWSGKDSIGKTVASGVYFYRITAKSISGKEFTDVKSMMFMK